MTVLDEGESGDRWLSDDLIGAADRPRLRLPRGTAVVLRLIAWTCWPVALSMIAAPVLLYIYERLFHGGHDLASSLVNRSLAGFGYLEIYAGLAAAGSVAAVLAAVSRLLTARRTTRGVLYTPTDVEGSTDLTVVGVTHRVTSGYARRDLMDSRSPLREAYHSAITALGFQSSTGCPRTILVTSSRASEGKSTTALGIAAGLAAIGKRVLLLDADLRDPSLHRTLGVDRLTGGTSRALSTGEWEGGRCRIEGLALDFMPVGILPPSPSALLARGFAPLLRRLSSHYDHVVIDGPPVMGLADAPIMSQSVEETLFVVKSGQSQRAVSAAVARLWREDDSCPCILTSLVRKREPYGGYYYAYDYTYGSPTASITGLAQ